MHQAYYAVSMKAGDQLGLLSVMKGLHTKM
jgi:hypothetical protein